MTVFPKHIRIGLIVTTTLCFFVGLDGSVSISQDPIFSGPQVGEKLPGFDVIQLRGDDKGQTLKMPAASAEKPVLLIFWNELGRPGFGLIRTITGYALKKSDKLETVIVLLSDDPEAKNFRGAVNLLPDDLTLGVAAAGKNGPGLYGLNRNVRMTVLVGKAGKTTANFTLVQPSVQADGPKILQAIAEAIGEQPPKLEDLDRGMQRMNARTAARSAMPAAAQGLMRQMLNKEAKPEQIDQLAEQLKKMVAENENAQKDLGKRCERIVNSGRLATYGTEAAQAWIKKWAEEYGPETSRK